MTGFTALVTMRPYYLRAIIQGCKMNHKDISRAICEALETALLAPGEQQPRPVRPAEGGAVRLSMQDVRIARIVLEPVKTKRRKLR